MADPDVNAFLQDAFRHLKAIGISGIPALAAKTGVDGKLGVTTIASSKDISAFIGFAKLGKLWKREAN